MPPSVNSICYRFSLDDEVIHDILASHPLLYVLEYFCFEDIYNTFTALYSR